MDETTDLEDCEVLFAHYSSVHTSVDRHLSWLHFLAIVSRSSIEMSVDASLWQNREASEDMPKSGTASWLTSEYYC